MVRYRLTHAAQDDVAEILRWTDEQFGEQARARYAALIVTAMRDVISAGNIGSRPRPELGEGVFTWHLAQSRTHTQQGRVHRPGTSWCVAATTRSS